MCIQIVINTYNRRKLHVNTANPSYCCIIFAKQVPFPIFFPLDRAKRNKMALKDNWCTVLFLLDISLVEISFSFMPNIPRWDDWTLLIKKNPSRMIFLLFFSRRIVSDNCSCFNCYRFLFIFTNGPLLYFESLVSSI